MLSALGRHFLECLEVCLFIFDFPTQTPEFYTGAPAGGTCPDEQGRRGCGGKEKQGQPAEMVGKQQQRHCLHLEMLRALNQAPATNSEQILTNGLAFLLQTCLTAPLL